MRPIDADKLEGKVLEWMPSDPCGIEEKEFPFETDLVASLIMEIKEAPTIEQPTWIPCSERMPEEKDAGILKKLGTSKRSDYVLATVEVKNERMTVTACTYDGVWDWNMKYAFPNYEVIAWMPLPKPYKEGEKE